MKNICEKLFLFLIPSLFTFTLFKENISSFLFILLTVNTVSYSLITKSYKNFKKETVLYTIPFWIILFFVVIRPVTPEGLNHVNHALFFLLFPIVFSLIPAEYFTREKLHFYFNILKNACLIMAIGYITAFLIKYDFSHFFVFKYTTAKFRDFVYFEIPFFKIHPTYFSSIVIFCAAFSFKKVLEKKAYFELFYVAAFLLITFLLLSKINIIFLVCTLIVAPLTLRRFSLKQKLATSFSFIVLGLAMAVMVPGVSKRFVEMFASFNSPPKGLSYDSTNVRVSIIKCSAEIAKEHYWFGVGFDKLQETLDDCYKANYNSDFYITMKYMTHNYFSYIFLSAGIFGLLLFLFYCYTIFRTVLKINQFLLYVMTLNILIICFTEDFFYRHYGIFFFHLIFMSYLNLYRNRETNLTNRDKTITVGSIRT